MSFLLPKLSAKRRSKCFFYTICVVYSGVKEGDGGEILEDRGSANLDWKMLHDLFLTRP